jgi:SAM-dependent methyltransferase
MDFLQKGQLISEKMTVLEIGCGTGMMAIELARQGAVVTALDFSRGMLEKFKADIPADLSKRITVLYADWHKIDIVEKGWEKKFDLVVAFMSPGVATPEAFFKMMRCTRNGCAIRGWAAKGKHEILSDLWEKIMGTPLADNPQSILYKINLLFSLGIFPEITFDPIAWEQDVTVQEEFESQMAFFKRVSQKSSASLEALIRPYLESAAVQGRIKRNHTGLTATVIWKMDPTGLDLHAGQASAF